MDCGDTAAHWSFAHHRALGPCITDEQDRVFSLRLADYEPRCVSCHAAYDSDDSLGRKRGRWAVRCRWDRHLFDCPHQTTVRE